MVIDNSRGCFFAWWNVDDSLYLDRVHLRETKVSLYHRSPWSMKNIRTPRLHLSHNARIPSCDSSCKWTPPPPFPFQLCLLSWQGHLDPSKIPPHTHTHTQRKKCHTVSSLMANDIVHCLRMIKGEILKQVGTEWEKKKIPYQWFPWEVSLRLIALMVCCERSVLGRGWEQLMECLLQDVFRIE